MKGTAFTTVFFAGVLILSPASLSGADAQASAATSASAPFAIQDKSDWTPIAGVGGMDRIAQLHVYNLLKLNNIDSWSIGGLGHDFRVKQSDADRAVRILTDDAKLNPYWLHIDDKNFELVAKTVTVQINQKIDEDGRVLANPRNPYIEQAVIEALMARKQRNEIIRSHMLEIGEGFEEDTTWDFVKHIEMTKRRYLNSEGHWNVGYDVTVVFGSTESEDAFYSQPGSVWDEGKQWQIYNGSRVHR